MPQHHCEICGKPIPMGEIHSCVGNTFHAPWVISLHNELIRIRELLEKQQQPAAPIAQPRAKTRETR